MDTRERLQDLAQKRNIDLTVSEFNQHPYSPQQLRDMLKGEMPPTRQGMLAILGAVAPVHGPYALRDTEFRITALSEINRLPSAPAWKGKTTPKERRVERAEEGDSHANTSAARSRKPIKPLTEDSSFAEALDATLWAMNTPKSQLAKAIGKSPEALRSYHHGHLPHHIEPITGWLRDNGAPEEMVQHVQKAYDREKAQHNEKAKHARSGQKFNYTLKTLLETLGISGHALDEQAKIECDETLQTALWIQPAGGMPEKISPLLHVLRHVGATEEACTRLNQAYLSDLERVERSQQAR